MSPNHQPGTSMPTPPAPTTAPLLLFSPGQKIRKGTLIPLRTKAEVQASDETVDAYILETPLRRAGTVLKIIKAIPGNDTLALHHLRRVVKWEFLPENVKKRVLQARLWEEAVYAPPVACALADVDDVVGTEQEVEVDGTSIPHAKKQKEGKEEGKEETLYILLCPTFLLPLATLLSLLSSSTSTTPNHTPQLQTHLQIHEIPIPLQPPPSPTHALSQSQTFWPTTYNPNNSYGPNATVLTRAAMEMERGGQADGYMDLARRVGCEIRESGCGVGVGVVVVERRAKLEGEGEEEGRVVCVAGDGRWLGCRAGAVDVDGNPGSGGLENWNPGSKESEERERGNPAAHAVMRAIGLVARKRKMIAHSQSHSHSEVQSPAHQHNDSENNNTTPSYSPQNTTKTSPPTLPTTTHPASLPLPTRIANQASPLYHDTPLSPLETFAFSSPETLAPNGYLCLNLEVYVSHEPCVMCCMALVHSRVGRVVFGRRMRGTGGLFVDGFGEQEEEEGKEGVREVGGEGEGEGVEEDSGGGVGDGLAMEGVRTGSEVDSVKGRTTDYGPHSQKRVKPHDKVGDLDDKTPRPLIDSGETSTKVSKHNRPRGLG